ncbi:hypothetical protein R3W88_020550 [Solanum pinnatisectum]|uniref:Uncharacterized protein n=1 Tax=Solanum pinnatisectum TaxID=50273 RepID=A0AAV9KNX6_9SOLN|nr:hypothetical protein R3W88_020550 [Solanum pinnatisectum]
MVVACCCWVSRGHGVEDVCGGFSVSMRRRRKGLFWGGDFWRFGGEWWLFGGVSDVNRGSKGWSGSPELASGCEVVGLVAGRKVGDGGCEIGKNGIV